MTTSLAMRQIADSIVHAMIEVASETGGEDDETAYELAQLFVEYREIADNYELRSHR